MAIAAPPSRWGFQYMLVHEVDAVVAEVRRHKGEGFAPAGTAWDGAPRFTASLMCKQGPRVA